ncbi:carboxylesterase/lipase family protein [Amycolatopsis sp. NPDC005003]
MTHSPLLDTAAGALRDTPLPGGGALFAGVPFAAPPVGPLRLRPPQPYRPWSGVRDATRFGPAAAQRVSALLAGSPAAAAGDLWATPAECGEDCLYLNVWTPDVDGRRPVLVWIHGGGFDSGSAALPNTDGAALSRLTGTVVVAANYRLGALGHLYLAELGRPECANLGLQDQAAALRWVRDHIAAFGGDPGNITVAGQSAGASSIGALLATPAAAGTFHRAILQSGHTERVSTAATATAIATGLLAALGLTDVDELGAVPVERIVRAQNDVVDADAGRRALPGGRAWGPVLDGQVLHRHPHQAVADGAAAGIGLLVGVNRDEMRLFQLLQGARYAPADEPALLAELRRAGVAVPERLLAAYRRRAPGADLAALRTMFLGDAAYRRPAARLAAAQTAAGGRAHTYLFAAEPQGPALGASHGVELPLVFDRIDPAVPHLRRLRDDFVAAWARFAADGDPGWPLHGPGAVTRQFGGDTELLTEPPADDVEAAWL